MNDSELEDISPGLLKIQQVLGHKNAKTHSVSDKKKLLIDALLHLAELMGLSLKIPSGELGDDLDDLMDKVATYSGIRIQKITLKDKWWTQDLGIFLGFIDDSPCVLVPKKRGGYQYSTPTEVIPLSPDELNKIVGYGFFFIKPLPKTANKLFHILKFSFSNLKNELKTIVYLQLGLSLILMSLPILMSYFFNHFTQFIESKQIALLAILLIINTLIFFLLSISQTIVMLNLRFKIQRRLEPAIWDRLLRLTPTFFRRFNAGDIAYRAGVVSTIQEMMTQSTILSLFGVMVAILAFILMCYYNLMLALLALLSVFIISSIIIVISHRLLIHQRKVYEYLIKLSGFVFQVMNGIMKFKASASEYRAFNIWSDYFSNLLIARYKADKVRIGIHIIHGSLLILMTLILFCIYFYFNKQMEIGTFIAFNVAFSQFFSALLTLTTFISSVLIITPLFEQSLVIFEAKIEPVQLSQNHVKLGGKIQIKNLSFCYENTQPLIYKNINLLINSGEVVGITGSSGCGKSTLFRILLGLEKPLDGQIFYDDVNMDMINLANLRQQIGVVTQKSVLTPGTILENIIGNDKHLTRNDAWNIIYHLGLEQMISALPMEMDTFINEGMQSLSGGEQQRIVLARALIKKPKILFLDEATSALDNQNQTKIQEYLATLKITQVIIAHRLSTLKSASRILVINEGRIIQEGNFEELIQTEGYFAELAKFQFPDFESKTQSS